MTRTHDKRVNAARTDLERIVDDLLAWLRKNQAPVVDIIRRDSVRARVDGYPTGTLGSGGGSSSDTSVERAVFAIDAGQWDRDVVHAQAVLVEANLRRVVDSIVAIQRSVNLVPRTVAGGDDALWCVSCLRVGHHSPRSADRNSRCSWCRDVCRTYGVDNPPLELVRLHHERRRLSEADYARFFPDRKGAA